MQTLALLFSALLAAALLCESAAAAEAVRRGIELCLGSVIPALFPFFTASSLLISLGASRAARWLARPFHALFRCPGAGAAAFLLGAVGGTPVGASCVAALVRRRELSAEAGGRLLAFCNNASPSFALGVVGLGVFGSVRAGAYLYLIHIAAAVLVGVLLRGRDGDAPDVRYRAPPPERFLPALLSAVQGAAVSILRVCAFVVFSLVLLSLVESAEAPLPPWAAGFLELTNGVLRLPPTRSGFLTAAALMGWGGLSVHGQTAAVMSGSGVKMTHYLVGKVLQSTLSLPLAAAVWHVMPPAA